MLRAIVDIESPKNGAIYALGDVHGCFEALIAIEEKIKRSVRRSGFSNFKIVSVGDLCDRGPDTKQVIEHFVMGKEAQTHELILGNHEMFFLLAFIGLRPDLLERAGIRLAWHHHILVRIYKTVTTQVESWRSNGGDSVFQSYGADIGDSRTWDLVPDSHLRLLFGAPLVAMTPRAIISHAVLHEGDLEVLRDCDDGKTIGNDKRLLEAVHRCLWERQYPSGRVDPVRRQVSGHTPVERVTRENRLGVIQIDTGAVYGRTLTAINLKNFRAISATSKFKYRRAQRDFYE